MDPRLRHSLLAILTVCSMTGCHSLYNGVDGCGTSLRNHMMAKEAWCDAQWCYQDMECIKDFGKGFKAGYRDILEGGKGCPPILPPRCYWSTCLHGAHRDCCVMAWFDGFMHGAVAAQQDGVGGLSQVPISPTARANFERARTTVPQYDWDDIKINDHGADGNYPAVPPVPPVPAVLQKDDPDNNIETAPEPKRPYEETPAARDAIPVPSPRDAPAEIPLLDDTSTFNPLPMMPPGDGSGRTTLRNDEFQLPN